MAKHYNYIGMPQSIYLEQFGGHIFNVFKNVPYIVGSVLETPNYRDIDIRLILPDDEYINWELGDPNYPHRNKKWIALVLAFSELGKKLTGLPIDFQIQQQTRANILYSGKRDALIAHWDLQ